MVNTSNILLYGIPALISKGQSGDIDIKDFKDIYTLDEYISEFQSLHRFKVSLIQGVKINTDNFS